MKFLRLVIASLVYSLPLGIDAQQAPLRSEFNAELAHDDAILAMRDGNYAIAFCIWHPLARNGDAQAQYSLGWMYHNGYGLRIDDERAFNWWLRAAARGATDAHHALGELYASGQGVEQNLPIALGWFISATLKGHELARETLVSMLTDSDPQVQKIFQQILKSDWSLLGTPMQVKVDRANTRSGPGKEFDVIHVLEKGHEVLPMTSEGDWIKVGISGLGKTAWIFNTLLAPAPGIYSVE